MADWEPVGEPTDVPAPSAEQAWAPVGDAQDLTPEPMRQMPTPVQESQYQSWVQQNRVEDDKGQPTHELATPGMQDRTVTVDPYGNGVDVDLRGLYSKYASQPFQGVHANPLDDADPKQLDPTPERLNEFTLPHSGRLTKDSIYAKGQPDSNIGSWGEDEQGLPEYHQPGWTPATRTQQVMAKASELASKAAGVGKNAAAGAVADITDPVTGLKHAAANAGDEGLAALKGLGGSFHKLAETANVVGGAVPVLYDKAKSLFTGKDTTAAQDAWFKNTVDPLTDQDDAFELAQNAGLPEKAAHMFGSSLGWVAQMILTGGEAAPLEAGASGGAAFKAAINHGVPAAALPATTDAIDTGRKVYAQTGDGAQAVKAAQVQYLVSTVGGFAPLHVPGGGLAARAAQGGAAGVVTGEAGREAMNTVLPQNMQTPFTGEGAALEAIGGATIAGVGGRRPKVPDADFAEGEGKDSKGGGFDLGDVPKSAGPQGGLPAPEAGKSDWNNPQAQYADLKTAYNAAQNGDLDTARPIVERAHEEAASAQAAADAAPKNKDLAQKAKDAQAFADYLTTHTGIDPNAAAPDTSPRKLSAPERRAETSRKTANVAAAADDSGEITTTHTDEGSTVNVNGKPVHDFDTKGAAEGAAKEAKAQVDERNVSAAGGEHLTPEQKQEVLETHPASNIPNRLAYDNSDKLPVQAAIEADSTGDAEADKKVSTAIATALHEATPNNAYHFGGDQFAVQGHTHEEVAATLEDARQRLDHAKVELTAPDGHTVTLDGIGFSHGTGTSLDEAHSALQSEKSDAARVHAAAGDEPGEPSGPVHQAGLPADEHQPAAQVVPRPRPTQLYRGTETGKGGLRRESHDGEMGRAIYATPHRWLAESYGGGPKARMGAGREVHELKIDRMEAEKYGYVHGGAEMGQRAELQDHLGNVLHTFDGTRQSLKGEREELRRVADAHGMKMLVGMPESIGHNQTAILDPSIIKDKGEIEPAAADKLTKNEPGLPIEEPKVVNTRSDMTPEESKFVDTIGDRTLGKHGQQAVSTIVQARKLYEEITHFKLSAEGLKRVDELVERAIVEKAREVVSDGEEPKLTYQRLVTLYNRQPNLNTRTSTSIENQAYSTPAPLAFLASDLAGITRKSTVLEPTAGNGMLLIAADPKRAIVNELNPERAASLKAQGFDVTQRDASDDVLSKKPVDVLIANPPFGVVRDADGESKSFALTTPEGKAVKTNEIDHAIVLKQLAAMKPDGRAVLLIGGPNKLAKSPEARSDAYNGAAKRKFFYHLYGNYNVVDHFTVSGDLYSRQGAAWPIDVLVVHGTGKSALRLPAVDVPRVYNDYPSLEALLGKTYDTAHRVDSAPQAPVDTAGGDSLPSETGVRPGTVPEPAGRSDSGDGGRIAEPAGGGEPIAGGDVLDRPGEGHSALQSGASGDRPGGGEPVRGGEALQLGRVPEADEGALPADRQHDGASSADVGQAEPSGRAAELGDADGSGGVSAERAYQSKSKAKSLDTLVPANMEHATGRALDNLESKVGPVDDYVAKELGYKKGELGKYFGAEQVDALGLAIHQIAQGKGFIIGDQTGIGKGRVVAGIIRYALKNGHTPIFVTEKPNLYGDIVRDLRNIGQDDIRPLMTDAGKKIPLEGGGEIKSAAAPAHNKILQQVVNEAKLAEHNMLFTTYSQIQVQGKRALRHEALDTLVPNAVMILDESHNAGGTDSGRKSKAQQVADGTPKTGRAALVRGYVGRAKGVFYSSATYAKRPSVMDLYSKTDMNLAVGGNVDKLPGAIAAGGVPLQQVVASQLADAGQYLRRERSFAGVDYNTPTVPVDRKAAETLASIMLAIKEFDDKKEGAVAAAKDAAKAEAASVSEDGSKGAAGATSTNFTSSMHNLIGQMLLGLKADKAADMAIEALKRGEKPVVTVANTMGSFIEQYADAAHLKGGDRIGIAFNDLAKRYLESSRFLTTKDVDGNKTKRRMTDEELGPEAVAAFNRVKKIINEASSIGSIPISPIDYIHKKLRDAGYKTSEITGRTHTIEYQDDGHAVYRLRGGKETSAEGKIKSITGFNNGSIDAMILNQSGATGLSLHSNKDFKDQRRRNMIIAQAEGNIDTHMQMLGRVHRTGQVVPPEFNQLVADIPAEKRPAAVLAKKMASLSANTTGARSGNFSSKETVDFMNQYGDEVAAQLMADMPEVHEKLGEPLDTANEGLDNEEAARKVTGRIPMLPVAEQEELYHLLESGYRERLAQADAMGENALEAKTLPLDAKPVKKVVLSAAMNGDSPFAAASHAETMDVKRVGKPMTSVEVRGHVAKELGMEGEPSLSQLADRGKRVAQQTAQDTRKDYQEYRNAEEAKMLASEQKEAAIAGRLVALDGVAARWSRVADLVHVGGSYEFTMPDNSSMMGVVTEVFKKKGVKMPVALGSWAAKVALADGAKQMTVPFSKVTLPSESLMPGKIQIAPRTRNPATGVGIEKMFDDGQSVSRENRVIITGNLLAGFSHIRGGQVIHFTDHKGEVRQGIMMPRSFKLDEFVENAPVHMPPDRAAQLFAAAPQALLKSADGAVTIARWGDSFAMNVAKSKAEGGKYFLDNGLRDITGDFVSVGGTMRAMLNKDQLPRALTYIQKKFEQKFSTTEYRKEALAAGGTSIGTEKASADKPDEAASFARDDVTAGDARPSHEQVQARISDTLDKFPTKFAGVHIFPTAKALFADPTIGPRLTAAGEKPGSFKGFVTPDGHYYAASDQFHSLSDVDENVAHEFIGHFGIREFIGPKGSAAWNEAMDGIARDNPEETARRGNREYRGNYDANNDTHRRRAADEVFGYFAQRDAAGQSVPQRIRRWLNRIYQLLRDAARRVFGGKQLYDKTWMRGTVGAIEAHLRGSSESYDSQGDWSAPDFGKNEPTFYSAVERAVETSKRDKGTGAEWEATLRNTPGIKDEEMKWLGLKDWLEGRGRVSRAEVADYVRAHKIDVGEKLLGMGNVGDEQHVAAVHNWLNQHNPDDLEHGGRAALADAMRGDADAIGELEQMGVPDHLMAPFYDTESANGDKVAGPTKYEKWAEPGGKNYRELLMTLPSKDGDALERNTEQLKQANEALRSYQVTTANGLRDPHLLALTVARDAIHRERTALMESQRNDYRSHHWDGTPNILAHVRFDDRTGPQGEKMLHIAELQSDWHQAGRKHGYQGDPAIAAAKAERKDGYWEVTTDDGRFISNVQDHNNPGVKTAQDAINVANFRLREAPRTTAMGDRVPDAPFKTTWPELAMKRMFRHAAENGYHAVSWDVGQTHVDRYNMGNEVDKIRVTHDRSNPGTYDVLATKNGRTVVERTGTPEGKLSDLLGKDMAQKAISERDSYPSSTFEGDDLKIGGAGMRGFYDDILPKTVQKLAKRLGSSVERGSVSAHGRVDRFDTDEAGQLHPVWIPGSLPAHLVRITDAMREGAMQGQPQFARDELARRIPITTVQPKFNGAMMVARRWAAQNIYGEHVNDESGMKIRVGSNALAKAMSASASLKSVNLKAHVDAVQALPALIKHAIVAESRPSQRDANTIHRLYAPLRIGNEVYRVKMTIKDSTDAGVRFYTHELQGMEIEPASYAVEGGERAPTGSQQIVRSAGSTTGDTRPIPPADTMSIADLLKGVIGDDGKPLIPDAAPQDGFSFARPELGKDDEVPKGGAAGAKRRTKAAEAPDEEDQSVRGPKAYELLRKGVLAAVNNKLVMDVRILFNPKDISALSKSTAATTTAFLGELAQQLQATVHHLEQFSRAMNTLNSKDLLDIDDDFEHGRPQRNAEYQPMADALRKLLDTWAENVRGLGEGHLENLIENYLPHIWKDADKAKSVFASAMSRRPMRGPMTFLKKRTIPTLREGIDLGLTPLTLNPLILTLLKVHEMQKFVSGVTMMRAYKDQGLARFFRATERVPDGWKKIDDAIARVSQWSEAEQGFIDRGYYAMPEDAARIINNHLGASPLENVVLAKGLRGFSNALIGFQLGFSGFHLGFTTNDAVVSKAALAVERLVHGEPLQAAKAFGEVLTGPVSAGLNLRRGYQLMRAYSDPAGATPEMRLLVNSFTGGGGRVTMDRYFQAAEGLSPFRGVGIRSLAEDIRAAMTQPEHKVAALTQALASFPLEYAQSTWRALQAMVHMTPTLMLPFEAAGRISRVGTSFIMEHIVPMQKMGVWSDMAKDWLRRNPNALPVERNNAMQSMWRSVDNRLGEVVYDNKFWNRTFKFALHLGLRAVGWRFGTIEEIGGGVFDTLKAIDNTIRTGRLNKEDFTHKMAYLLGLTIVQSLSGALLQYLMTGEGPRDLKDLMFPRTGRRHKDGTEERLTLPSYVKDVYEYLHHPGKAVLNMANPAIGAIKEQVTGLDWKDQPYLNPNEDAIAKFDDHVKHLFEGFHPMSMSKQNQFEGASEPGATGFFFQHAPQIGLTSAPGYITKTEQLERAQKMRDESDYQKALYGKIRAAQNAGDKAEVARLRTELRGIKKDYHDDKRDQGIDRRTNQKAARAGNTSALMDRIGPLLDQGGTRADMAARVERAGYPALAGLLGSMPDRLRPEIHAAIEREAS